MPFNKAPMCLAQWYGNAVPVPNLDMPSFQTFLATSIGLITSVVDDVMDTKVSVNFTAVETAAADIEHGRIQINQSYVYGKFGKFTTQDSDWTASIIMGLIVHEAGHFAFSPLTTTPWATHILTALPKGVYFSDNTARTLGNVVEDIYIEHEVDRRVPLISWTLDSLNDAFFPEQDFEKMQSSCAHILEQPTSILDGLKLLSLCLFAKTREECNGSEYVRTLFGLARSASELSLIEDRLALAADLYLAIFGRVEEPDSECKLPSPLPGGVGEKSLEDILVDIEVYGLGGTAGAQRKAYSGGITIGGIESLNKTLERMEGAKVRFNFDYEGVSESTKFFLELNPSGDREVIEPDLRYERLAEVARQRASVNRPYGADRERGYHIRKLHRIATDQKIFAEPVLSSAFQPMQVMVVVDTSGSMFWGGTFKTKPVYQAYTAGIGAMQALLNARCSVALFGHTADSEGHLGTTVLFRLKSFNESVRVANPRASTLINRTAGYLPGNNRDGDALLYLSDKFTHQFRRRLMIVISDGQPNANLYVGDAAVQHCRASVEKIRSKRIDVISISITEEANLINEKIYGKENNVFNEDPNVIESVIQRILTN